MNENERPDPDALLAGIHADEIRRKRGRLKVFFGMCPGVGKTFAMLRAAQEKKSAGVNVVVGWVDTHGRGETEKVLAGLDVLPRKRVEYKSAVLEEFDLERALELKPNLILVDELAHSNAPGSRHPKRYQDIRELLFAGIDVYTTLNVQHIESRAESVYQISGVAVRETVPDHFLEDADQIELIDLPPEDLLRRLREGKVYLGDRAERAAENFFRSEKLTALRELALRFTAEIVDDQLRDQMQEQRIPGPWNTNERLMVAVSHSPFSARLIRATRRKSASLEAPWVALYVDPGTALSPEDHERLAKNLNLARELGAEVITTKDQSIANALRRVAAERNVTQILMGRPDRRFFRDLFGGGTILDRLVNETSEVDIHVIRQLRKPIYRGFRFRIPKLHTAIGTYVKAISYLALLCALGYPLRPYVGYRAIGFGFLLGILPIATLAGRGPTILAAALTAVVWDFFFIPPQFAFTVKETEDGMMILAYFAVASVAGFLAARIKRQENDLRGREQRANVLYEFGRKLGGIRGGTEIAKLGARSLSEILPGRAVILTRDAHGELSRIPLNTPEFPPEEKEFAVASWSLLHAKKAGWRTDTLSSSACFCIPLRGRSGIVGVIALYPSADRSLTLDQDNLIETICGHLATALERESLEAVSRRNEIYAQSEKLHQTLLNTVSHELRTPLTALIGGATALGDPRTFANPENRRDLLDDLVLSAERLNRTVENLLDMSRLSSGVLKLDDAVFELNDFIRSVHARIARVLKTHAVTLDLCDADLFVKGDEKILEHVLQNLVLNASQHSAAETTITVRTGKNQAYAEFSVSDEGRGLRKEDLEKVFDRFYRSADSAPGGVGLGLSIAKAMMEAHGGAVFAANHPLRNGAVFTALLPLQTVPREVFE